MIQTKYENVYAHGAHLYRLIKGEYHQLSEFVDNVGYYQTVFRVQGIRKYVRVHRLIAETLIPNLNGYPIVNHIDGNKLNNDPSNLEWVTNSYNTQDGYNNGYYHSYHRSHKIKAIHKISKEEIVFVSIRECSANLGLNRKTLTNILKGIKTNNYPYIFEYIEECND